MIVYTLLQSAKTQELSESSHGATRLMLATVISLFIAILIIATFGLLQQFKPKIFPPSFLQDLFFQ